MTYREFRDIVDPLEQRISRARRSGDAALAEELERQRRAIVDGETTNVQVPQEK